MNLSPEVEKSYVGVINVEREIEHVRASPTSSVVTSTAAGLAFR